MDENKKDLIPPAEELPQEEPLILPLAAPAQEDAQDTEIPVLEPLILAQPQEENAVPADQAPVILVREEEQQEAAAVVPVEAPREQEQEVSDAVENPNAARQAEIREFSQWLSDSQEEARRNEEAEMERKWAAPKEENEGFFTPVAPEATAADPEMRPRAPRKGRPKRKKGYGLFGLPHLLATVVWLAIIVMIGTSLGRMLWVCAADVLAFGRESKKVSITITSNDTIDDIAKKLQDAELIRYPEVFKLYAKLAVDEGDIIPGTFEMDTLYDYHALVVQMGPRSSNRAVVEDVLIPEGMNCRQIFELLEQKNVCTVAELEEYAANGEFADFWFLEGIERGDRYCLEGFLFPDTYDFYANSTPREALGKMLLGFEARYTEDLQAQLPGLNERLSNMMRANGCSDEYIAEHQLTLREVLIVASLVEEETSSAKESAIIASVIFNRLTQDQMYERYLNIDAAIIYATGDANNIDTSFDHPYNTYLYPGLTPGPISNPGLDSIKAVLNFADTSYYYYVLNPETGTHQFSQTLEEHEKWVEEFKNYDGGEE